MARGFVCNRVSGSHAQYWGQVRGQSRLVTVDMHFDQFDPRLLKRMLDQSGLTHREFYGSTKATARKIGLRASEYPIPLEN